MTTHNPQKNYPATCPQDHGTGGDRSQGLPVPVPAAIRRGQGTDRDSQPWLAAKREALGRRTHPDTCHHCQREVLVGLDADACALTATVDTEPASPLLETIHLLSGGHSYDHVFSELHHRDPHYLTRRDYPVLLSHQCRQTTEAELW